MAKLHLIRTIAVQKGILMGDIAKQLGVSRQALSQLIQRNDTSIANIEKIAKILDVDCSLLINGPVDDDEPVAARTIAEVKDGKIVALEQENATLRQMVADMSRILAAH